MVALIAPEKDIKDEMTILDRLFKAGLEYFHLRKYRKTYQEHCTYLDQIDPRYYDRVVVHSFHGLINTYPLKGIHFPEAKRKEELEQGNGYPKDLNLNGKTISSSFHDPLVLAHCGFGFDYHLLSPVFSSISKKGYEGRKFDVNGIDKKIIGMGGATVHNLIEFSKLGFKGVGVLGGIWNSTTPVADFKAMKNYFSQTESTI